MNIAYNAAYSEAKVKMATDPGYQPSAHIAELAGIVAKQLGVEATTTNPENGETGVTDLYHVYYNDTDHTITMLYGDNKFSLKADAEAENNLYPNIKGTITFSSSKYWDSTYTAFGNSSYPYVYDSNSNLYQYVENYKTKLGNAVSKVRLAAYEEIKPIWDNRTNYPWIKTTSYWFGSAYGASDYYGVWCVTPIGTFDSYSCDDAYNYGVRPVIEFTLE